MGADGTSGTGGSKLAGMREGQRVIAPERTPKVGEVWLHRDHDPRLDCEVEIVEPESFDGSGLFEVRVITPSSVWVGCTWSVERWMLQPRSTDADATTPTPTPTPDPIHQDNDRLRAVVAALLGSNDSTADREIINRYMPAGKTNPACGNPSQVDTITPGEAVKIRENFMAWYKFGHAVGSSWVFGTPVVKGMKAEAKVDGAGVTDVVTDGVAQSATAPAMATQPVTTTTATTPTTKATISDYDSREPDAVLMRAPKSWAAGDEAIVNFPDHPAHGTRVWLVEKEFDFWHVSLRRGSAKSGLYWSMLEENRLRRPDPELPSRTIWVSSEWSAGDEAIISHPYGVFDGETVWLIKKEGDYWQVSRNSEAKLEDAVSAMFSERYFRRPDAVKQQPRWTLTLLSHPRWSHDWSWAFPSDSDSDSASGNIDNEPFTPASPTSPSLYAQVFDPDLIVMLDRVIDAQTKLERATRTAHQAAVSAGKCLDKNYPDQAYLHGGMAWVADKSSYGFPTAKGFPVGKKIVSENTTFL